MKLSVRGLLACVCLLAGLLLAGCGSTPEGPFFLDNPQSLNSGPAASPSGSRGAAPSSAAGVARFHVGDTVTVSFSGVPVPIPDHVETIKEDGDISLPLIGRVSAVGKTSGELQNEIQADYVPKYYVQLTVTVKSGDRYFYAGGEVNHPGREVYTDGLTVTTAIQTAGGLTDFANHSKVWLIRGTSGQRIQVNYDKALENPAKDPPVYPNDQIIVDRRVF